MPQIVDGLKDPYGLNKGAILSGSVTVATDVFWYYVVTTGTIANIKFSNLSGSSISASFTAGQSIYGNITSVTQSAGLAIIYSGSAFPGY